MEESLEHIDWSEVHTNAMAAASAMGAAMLSQFPYSQAEAPALETAARNPKHKKEVCRYWLNSKCMKGSQCEFLHALDHGKMPMCTAGDLCASQACTFKHPDPNRPICANYQVGFCSFGRRCTHRHVAVAGPPPAINPYYKPTEYAANVRAAHLTKDKTFRRKPCEYFQTNGWCPYFDMCNFKHHA